MLARQTISILQEPPVLDITDQATQFVQVVVRLTITGSTPLEINALSTTLQVAVLAHSILHEHVLGVVTEDTFLSHQVVPSVSLAFGAGFQIPAVLAPL